MEKSKKIAGAQRTADAATQRSALLKDTPEPRDRTAGRSPV